MIRVPVTPFLLRWAAEHSQRTRFGLRSGTEAAR